MRVPALTFLCLALLSLCAVGDTLTLLDGRSFEGTVVIRANVYTVQADDKLYQFRKHEVQSHNGETVTAPPTEREPNPLVRVKTSKGDMTFELFEDAAPNTVANLISLAEDGFYKGMSFHRIIPGFMAQGGCPNSKAGAGGTPGTGGPGYRFEDECSPSLTHSGRGILSMANSGPNTNGSQFFICFQATPHLNGRHTVFGRITEGGEAMEALESIGTRDGKPKETVRFDIEVVRKRSHPYAVRKLAE